MSTFVFSKKQFIKYLQKGVDEDELIIWTADKVGHLSVNSKKGFKQVTFAFGTDAFAKPDGVGDMVFGSVRPCSFCICKPTDVSKLGKEMIEKQKIKQP